VSEDGRAPRTSTPAPNSLLTPRCSEVAARSTRPKPSGCADLAAILIALATLCNLKMQLAAQVPVSLHQTHFRKMSQIRIHLPDRIWHQVRSDVITVSSYHAAWDQDSHIGGVSVVRSPPSVNNNAALYQSVIQNGLPLA
jgi:hypothetical protein